MQDATTRSRYNHIIREARDDAADLNDLADFMHDEVLPKFSATYKNANTSRAECAVEEMITEIDDIVARLRGRASDLEAAA